MDIQSTAGANPYITPVHTRLDLTGKKVVTIAELMAEYSFQDALNDQYIGKDGKVIDVSKLDRIPVEELLEGLYTPEFDTNIENGLRYQRSCFDYTNSWEFAKLTAAEDFTGMSDSEIYKAIYEKYQYCYGKNFYYSKAISYPIATSEFDDYNKIIRRFNNEVAAALGGEEQVKAARREALYGDMSDYEVRQAIIDEYDLSDGMTFRELYKMTYDIWKVGLDGGLHNRLDELFYDFSTAESRANCDNIAAREKYLDTKVSGKYFSELQKFYDNAVYRGNGILPEYSAALNQIKAACRVSSRDISVSSVSSASSASSVLLSSFAARYNLQWLKLQ
ncbi:MAG: hypothetical protein K2N60_02645 [Oscillospiraceae bacterium]|nr:hypothetical protein [Oscillospiraceae bacterium]